MALYSTHPTVATSDLWSASNQMTYVKANFDFISETRSIWFPIGDAKQLDGQAQPEAADIVSSGGGDWSPTFPVLKFDHTLNEVAEWRSMVCPPDYVGTPVLKVHGYMGTGDTSKAIAIAARIAAVSAGDGSVEGKSYGLANELIKSVPDDADEEFISSLTMVNEDSLTAGDRFNLWLIREAGDAGDTASNSEWIVTAVELQYRFV